MAFTSVTLTGSYANRTDGTPARGYVSFQLAAPLINGTTIAPAVEEKVHLTNGAFTINLPVKLGGVSYRVFEEIAGAERNYVITLQNTPAAQDLATLIPA